MNDFYIDFFDITKKDSYFLMIVFWVVTWELELCIVSFCNYCYFTSGIRILSKQGNPTLNLVNEKISSCSEDYFIIGKVEISWLFFKSTINKAIKQSKANNEIVPILYTL